MCGPFAPLPHETARGGDRTSNLEAILSQWFPGGVFTLRKGAVVGRLSMGGTGTIGTGTTSVSVPHGFGRTPSPDQITITPTSSAANDPGTWWIAALTDTNFEVHVRADPGAGGWSFAWRLDPT